MRGSGLESVAQRSRDPLRTAGIGIEDGVVEFVFEMQVERKVLVDFSLQGRVELIVVIPLAPGQGDGRTRNEAVSAALLR